MTLHAAIYIQEDSFLLVLKKTENKLNLIRAPATNKLLLFAGNFVLVWKKGTTLLSAGSTMISRDPRLSLIGYNLQLRDIRHADQGDYICQIGDGTISDLTHTVEILSEYNKTKCREISLNLQHTNKIDGGNS